MSEPVIAGAYVEIRPKVDRFKGQLESEIRAGTSGVDAQVRRNVEGPVNKSMGRVRGAIGREVGSIRGAIVGGLGALAAVNFFKGGLDEIKAASAGAKQTEAALRSTGGAAKVTAGDIASLAGKIQDYSGIEDDAIVKGQNLLLTFTGVRNEVGKGNDVFTRATRAAADLSTAGFGSMESASIQLGKALNDPVKGMTAMGRSGVTFTESQKKTIEALVKTGRTLEAQKIILAEVERQVGGSAKAYGESLPGQIDRGKRALEGLQEEVVGGLAPAIEGSARMFREDFLPAIKATFNFIGRNADVIKPLAAVALGLVAVNKVIKVGNAIFDSSVVKIGRRIAANRAQIISEGQVAAAVATRNAAESGSGSLPDDLPGSRRFRVPGVVKKAGAVVIPVGIGVLAAERALNANNISDNPTTGIAQLRERQAKQQARVNNLTASAGGRGGGLDVGLLEEARRDLALTTKRLAEYEKQLGITSTSTITLGDAQRETGVFLERIGDQARVAVSNGITPFRAAINELAPAIADIRGKLNDAITPFEELPEKAAVGRKKLLANLLSQEQDKAKLAADFKVLAQSGIGTPLLNHLYELEQKSPGTVRALVKGGISHPFASELNERFSRILGSNGELAVWLAGVASQENLEIAARKGAALGKATAEGWVAGFQSFTGGGVTVQITGTQDGRPIYVKESADRELGRSAGAKGVRG